MKFLQYFLRTICSVLLVVLLLLWCVTGVTATERNAQGEIREAAREDIHHPEEVQVPVEQINPEQTVPLDEQTEAHVPQHEDFDILETSIAPGTSSQLSWEVELSSLKFDIPVIVVHGAQKGPVVGIIAALHGDELNGIEIARQVVHSVDPKTLSGTLIAVPIVNIEGFVQKSRYMADRRDLNRYFPGSPAGVTPARLAHNLFNKIILKCDALIDLHTGSYYRTNLPQLRADMSDETVADMVTKFGAMTVVHSAGAPGMLRNAASSVGIPAVTMEVGGPLVLEPHDVSFGVKAVNSFLGEVGMIPRSWVSSAPKPFYCKSHFLIAEYSGILLADVKLGDEVKKGDRLAIIVDPVSNVEQVVESPYTARILGMAMNQFVSAGYVIFRFGVEQNVEDIIAEAKKGIDDGTFP